MSRLSFRPRPLDIHKKLPIVKSVKDFEDDDGPTPTRNSQHLFRIPPEVENEVHQSVSKKNAADIPTPQYLVVSTYERDYLQTFSQPTSYLRARGARAEITEFVEYDLDNEDDDWLDEFNELDPNNQLSPEKLELMLFKFEVLDHKARERAGIITPTLGAPIPVILLIDVAFENQVVPLRYDVFEAVFEYWKTKRERWQKPILRRLQPPPPVNDTNPYNVFRPREKAHRLHTRRMQRRENNVHSFEKLRLVRRNLDQAKSILEALIKREEKKREAIEIEVSLQRLQWKYKNHQDILEHSLALTRYPATSAKFASSEDELESEDIPPTRPRGRPPAHTSPFADTNVYRVSRVTFKQGTRRRHAAAHGWLNKIDPLEPVLLFAKPLIPEKLAAAGIVPPSDSPSNPPYRFHGRVGRGGRIIFDRLNPYVRTSVDLTNSYYVSPTPRP